MDDYIKRKKRPGNIEQCKQTQSDVIIRETRQQIDDVMHKVRQFQQRVIIIKNRLIQIQCRTIEKQGKLQGQLLGITQMQKPCGKTQVFDWNTSTTDKIVSKNPQLGGAQKMVDQRAASTTRQHSNDSLVKQLPQTSKRSVRKGRPRK